MIINLVNEKTGQIKRTKLGFSWTMLFFGVFVPLFRGDGKWFIISFILSFITVGISWLIFPFIYNKIYINKLLEKGYIPADDMTREALVRKNIISENHIRLDRPDKED